MPNVFAAIALSGVTGGFTALETAVLAASAAVITGAMGLMAVKRGGVWLKSLWARFNS